MVIKINFVEHNGWLFILPPDFLIQQTRYLNHLKQKDKKLLKSFEEHKKRFQKNPLKANRSHRLRYGLHGLRSACCCSGSRLGDRLIFLQISKRAFYLLEIILGHDYKNFQKKVAEIYPQKTLMAIKKKYQSCQPVKEK